MAAASVVALGVGEVALRLIGFEYSPLQIAPLLPSDWRYYHSLTDEHFVFDPYLIWRPKPSFDIFNAQGYRGAELPAEKAPGEFRVLAVGDSNTLGWNNGGPNWPEYLEQLLAADHKGVHVVNAGVWGYSSFQGLRRLERSLSLQPDLVLVSFGSNDALPVAMTDVAYARRVSATGTLGRSRLGQLLLQAWDGVTFSHAEQTVDRVPIDQYEANLHEFVRMGREHGFEVVLLTRPFIGDIPVGSWKSDGRRNNRATLRVAEEEGVLAIDVYDAFVTQPKLFADESHFTEEGHRLAARLIYERIRGLVK